MKQLHFYRPQDVTVSVCVYVQDLEVSSLLSEPSGVDTRDWIEPCDAALGGGVEALGLSAHLEEHFLFLQFPGKLFLQSL